MKTIFLPFLFVGLVSCKKNWLEEKPSQILVVPNTIKDIQLLLDNTNFLNSDQANLGDISCDDYYISNNTWSTRPGKDRNIYSWASTPDFYEGAVVNDWDRSYYAIFIANTALENINKITPDDSEAEEWGNVKGSALFFRAYMHYTLAQLFCKTYIPSSAASDLGIILRQEPDVTIPGKRSTVQQTYDLIITDLKEAINLLPSASPNGLKTKPCKPAAFGMLARVYLTMQDYDNALIYSDSCLNRYNLLMDYNGDPDILPGAVDNPFKLYNKEVIFHSRQQSTTMTVINGAVAYVDSSLLNLYAPTDRRKSSTVFFRTTTLTNNPPPAPYNVRTYFNGHYGLVGVTPKYFCGITTSEIYLIRAECYARKGRLTEAMNDLNTLLQKRMAAPFTNVIAIDADDALRKILLERRKELCFRGIRWTDLRRLNQDPRFQVTLRHGLAGSSPFELFTLPPNDKRYVFPIPQSEINFNNIPQNPR